MSEPNEPHLAPDGSGATTTLSDDEYFKFAQQVKTDPHGVRDGSTIDVSGAQPQPSEPTPDTPVKQPYTLESGGGDELTITIKGVTLHGWQEVRFTRGLEHFPMDFDIGLTEKFPRTDDIVIRVGDPCQVKIGRELVLTGFVDRYEAEISAESHSVRIAGRSRCSDLVDCSAYFGRFGEQLAGSNYLHGTLPQIAARLIEPFNAASKKAKLFDSDIQVVMKAGDGDSVPSMMINCGMTPFELLSEVARWNGFLVYDDEAGNLIFDRVGSETMSGNIVQGKNVEAAALSMAMDQRYSDYFVLLNNINVTADSNASVNGFGYSQDEGVQGVGRFRPLYIITQLTDALRGQELGQRVADWERNRRYGHANVLRVTIPTWRDSAGVLFKINHRIEVVDIPAIKAPALKGWIIGQVTFRRDLHHGTQSELVLMPREAFDIEPINLTPMAPDLIPNPQKDPPETQVATGGEVVP